MSPQKQTPKVTTHRTKPSDSRNTIASSPAIDKLPHFSQRQLILTAVAFVLFGIFVVFVSRAATAPLATVQAEIMTLPAGSSVVNDSTADDAKALLFKTNGEASTQFSLPSVAASSLVVRARGTQCNGAPQMVVKVDGVQVSSSAISSSSWTDYPINTSASIGTHALIIGFSNDYSQYAGNSGNLKCSRDLYIDKMTLFGETTATPISPPTVSINTPESNATVSGSIPVQATAGATSPNTVTKVEFYIDGALKATEAIAPYCMAGDGNASTCYGWDSKTLENGSHTLTAYAYDSAGNKSSASTVSFTVSNLTSSDPAGWKLLFEDNFSGTAGTSPNSTYWGLYDGPGHGGHGYRRPSAVKLDGSGNLVITALKGSDGLTVSGGMGAKLSSTYGRFEARVRTEIDNSGVTSGLVMTWPNSNRWPDDGENDFYETGTGSSATRNPFKSYIHYAIPKRTTNFQDETTHYVDGTAFHVMTMEWTPDFIKIYRDGALVKTINEATDTTTNNIPDVAHHYSIQLDANNDNPLGAPVKMYVDYVKHYTKL
jgi:endo-1,3-1,4-beta-glycanase ExoK